jgi:hypothetical protein
VHGSRGTVALGGAFERGHAPVLHLVVENGEGRFVKPNDVYAKRPSDGVSPTETPQECGFRF